MRPLLVALVIVLAGCAGPSHDDGPPGSGDDGPAGGDPVDVYRSGHALEGKQAPAYSATPLNGGAAALEDLHGDVVLLTVWASWCTICKGDEPTWEALHADYAAAGFTLFAVSREASQDAAQGHADREAWAFPALWGSDVNDAFSMREYQPNYVLIDRDGVVRSVYDKGSLHGRPGGSDALRADIETLLAMPTSGA